MNLNGTYICIKEYSETENLISRSIKKGDVVDIENIIVGNDYYIYSISKNINNIKYLGCISENKIEKHFKLEKEY